jgi:hypothetical protein
MGYYLAQMVILLLQKREIHATLHYGNRPNPVSHRGQHHGGLADLAGI